MNISYHRPTAISRKFPTTGRAGGPGGYNFFEPACDEEDRMPEGKEWVDGVVSDLEVTGESTKSTYASFMGEDEDTSHLYADGWDRLKALKKKMDVENVFKYSQPKL